VPHADMMRMTEPPPLRRSLRLPNAVYVYSDFPRFSALLHTRCVHDSDAFVMPSAGTRHTCQRKAKSKRPAEAGRFKWLAAD